MRIPFALLLALTLTACGQSGDLYLPPPEPAKTAPQPAPADQTPEQDPDAKKDSK